MSDSVGDPKRLCLILFTEQREVGPVGGCGGAGLDSSSMVRSQEASPLHSDAESRLDFTESRAV